MTAMRLRRHSSVKSDWKCPVQMYGSEKRKHNVITLRQTLRTAVSNLCHIALHQNNASVAAD